MRSWHYLLAALLLCLAIAPAAAWSPPTDTAIYGVEWNASDPSPGLQWIDSDGDPISQPAFDNHVVWGNVRRVVLYDNGTVRYGTNPRGDNLDLTPDNGTVMTEIPAFYVRSENASTGSFKYYRWWISPENITGFELHPAFVQRGGTARPYIYIGSYEATLEVNATGSLVLSSRTGEQPWTGYAGTNPKDGMFKLAFDAGTDEPAIGATVAGATSGTGGQVVEYYVSSGSWTGDDAAGVLYLKQTTGTFTNDEYLQIGGNTFAAANTPGGNAGLTLSVNTAEAYGENRGPGYGNLNVWSWSAVRMLYHIEAASWNSQAVTGRGIVAKAGGTGYNGEVTGFDGIDSAMAENGTGCGSGSPGYTSVSYRTMENLWGNTASYLTGYTATDTEHQYTKQDGTGSLSQHPLAAGSYESSTAAPFGDGVYTHDYWTSLAYEDLLQYQFMPDGVGGSPTTYGTDRYYTHIGEVSSVLLCGGKWSDGDIAGIGELISPHDAGFSYPGYGGRLEYVGATTPPADIYAYGDSITAGPGLGENYVYQYRDLYAPTKTVNRSTDGSGKTSAWGLENIATHLNGEETVFIFFGLVDPKMNITPETTASNLLAMYDYVQAYGGTPHILIPHLIDYPGAPAIDALAIETNLSAHNVSYYRIYDALDSVPRNGQLDAYNGTCLTDGVSPNVAGHRLIAEYIGNPPEIISPSANFSTNVTRGCTPLVVQFSDTSSGNVTSWNWTFGDGGNSTEQNPTHTYTTPGTYTVSLTGGSFYGTDTATTTITVAANIYAYGDSITAWYSSGENYVYQYRNLYAPTKTVSKSADGSGKTSAWGLENIATHLNGEETVFIFFGTNDANQGLSPEMTASNLLAMYDYVQAYGGTPHILIPHLIEYPNVISIDPMAVEAILSAHNVSYYRIYDALDSVPRNGWLDAYNGTYLVDGAHPSPEGHLAIAEYIGNPPLSPSADFVVDTGSDDIPPTVQFSDTSTGAIAFWLWSFGDGQTSTEQNPTHTYTTLDTYTVSLTVRSLYGVNTTSQTFQWEGPAPSFSVNDTDLGTGEEIQFTDTSVSQTPILSWGWNFGDGSTSIQQHPTHSYAFTGTYTVTLTVANKYGAHTATQTIHVFAGTVPDPTLPPTISPGSTPTLNSSAFRWDPETGYYTGYWFNREGNFIDVHGLFFSLMLPLTQIFGSWLFLIIWGTLCMGFYLYTQDTTMPFIVGILGGSMMAFLMGEDALVVMLLTMAFAGGGILAKVLLGRV